MRPVALSLALILWAPAVAAGVAISEMPFTEGEYLAVGLGDAAVSQRLGEEREVAAAELARSRLPQRPFVELGHEEVEDGRETSLLVAWTPPWGRARALVVEAAQAGLGAAEARLEAARLGRRLELRQAFAAWSFAHRRQALLASHRAQLVRFAEQLEAQARAGETAGLAARRLRLEASQLELELAAAEAELAAARADAGERVRQDLTGRQPVAPSLELPPTRPSGTDAPALRALAREVARAQVEARRSEVLREVPELGLGWKRIEEGPVESSGPIVRLSWPLPWPDGRDAARQAAAARLAAAQAALALAESAAQARVAAAAARLELLQAGLARAASPDPQPLVAAATAAYQAGESSLTDLLDTLRAVLAVRLASLETEAAALAAHRDLEAAAGRALSGDLP